jgi:hypothetical protein
MRSVSGTALPVFSQLAAQVLVARHINTRIGVKEIGGFQLNLMDFDRPILKYG